MKVNERDEKGNIKKIVIVLKWGGELSSTGYKDAIELGKLIRNERYKDDDLLSLYSSYQHDLKTYSSE
jgi:inositol hexakisphosphate/diphosphoinositol-pentakisphosphate kinase